MQRSSLDLHLSALRQAAGLSQEQVCAATKIQPRYVAALEAGRYGELPSNTHLRAFSLAITKACGGDPDQTAALVAQVLAGSAPLAPTRSFDTPAARPPAVPDPARAFGGGGPTPRLASDGPGLPAPSSSLASASARLRSLPLLALLGLLGLAGALSYSAAWGMEHWRARLNHEVLAAGAADAADAAAPAASLAGAPAAASAAPGTAAADNGAIAALRLTLRARRPCWLVLEIDGQRLPTVTMKDGDKLNWSVHQRAVLLAGNVGALRVWWRGDNLGYLGELDHRANAIVFDPGKAPRYDKTAALKLPPGVPD